MSPDAARKGGPMTDSAAGTPPDWQRLCGVPIKRDEARFLNWLVGRGVLHIEYRTNDDGAGGQMVDPDGTIHSINRPATRSQRLVGVWTEVTQ